MKKLLIATDCFLPRWDGVTRFLIEMLPRLKKHFKITVIAPKFIGNYVDIEGVEVIRMPVMDLQVADINFAKPNYKKIKEIVKEHHIIFSQTIGPIGSAAMRAAAKYKRPLISFMHSIEWELTTKSITHFKHITNSFTKLYARYLYNKCSLIIVPFPEAADLLRKNGITSPTQVVHLGTNTKRFAPPEDKARAKQELGIKEDTVVIGFHGRFGREKNLITLYRAFRKIEKKYDNLKLLLVGKGVKSIEEMFTSDRNMILPGASNNVIPFLQAMDIYVLPSLTETTSLSTLEAMSCALPVVVTPVGYVKQYVVEKENGLFFPFKNSLVLAMKLEVLIQNKKLREILGRNGRRMVEKEFSWNQTSHTIIDILNDF